MKLNNFEISNNSPFVLIAGPCQIESKDHSLMVAESIKTITDKLGIPFIFKSSFDKANRSSVNSQRGVGIGEGLRILEEVKTQFGVPVLTDVHERGHVYETAQVVDVIQIPAFLCRQTDLLLEVAKQAGAYKRLVNVKKGQFLAPWDMSNVADKFVAAGFDDLMLCERGASFGYNRLVSDMTSLPTMAQFGYPVIYDATHSVQQPGGLGNSSGGNREMVPYLAKAAIAVGCAGVFMETHQDPDNAPCDGPNMVQLDHLEQILEKLKALDEITKM